MSIRTKISVSFIITFIVVISFVAAFVGIYSTNIIRDDIYSYLYSSNKSEAEHIQTFLGDQKTTAVILAGASVYLDFLKEPVTSKQYPIIKEKIYERFARTKSADSRIVEVDIIGLDGKILVSSNPGVEGDDESQDEYFIEGKEGTFIKDVYYLDNKELTYAVSTPILDNDDTLLGVSLLRYSPDLLYTIIEDNNKIGKTEENFLINKDKFFITPSAFLGKDAILKQKVETENSADCFRPDKVDYISKNGYGGLAEKFGSQIVEAIDYRGVIVMATNSYIPETGWCLITKVDSSEMMAFRITMTIYNFLILVGAIIIFSLLGYWISKKITKPLKNIQLATDNINKGDYSVQVAVESQDEIGDLARSFNKMATEVENSRSNIEKTVIEQTQELRTKALESDNQRTAILNILEDVESERKKVEILAADLEKIKIALDNASDLVVVTDPEGIVIYGNLAIEKITGYHTEEAIGKKAGTLWRLPMGTEYYKKLWDTIKNKKEVFVDEIRNKRKNGELYTASINISPVLNKAGVPVYFVGIEHDITERKEAEDQVRKVLNDMQEQAQMLIIAKAKDEAVLAGIGDGIVTTNQDGVITLINDSALKILGYSRAEVLNKPAIEVFHMSYETGAEVPLNKRPIVLALTTGERSTVPLGSTYYYKRGNGSRFPVGITVTPFLLNGKIVGTIEVFRDITIEKDVDKAKTEFVSLASHQLRTPLTSIGWYAEMLLAGDAGKINEQQKDYLDEIYKGNKRMVELVNSLLNVSRIELGTFSVEPVLSDLKEIADSVISELKPIISEKKMKVQAIYGEGLDKISLDAKLIRIVYQNLFTNALKYTPDGGSITLEIKVKDQTILSSVADTGYGIPQNQQGEIFQKLFRADNVKIKDTGGTGLGLYIVRSIIEQSCGGKIWFESVENKGTTFFFTIPKGGMEAKKGSRPIS